MTQVNEWAALIKDITARSKKWKDNSLMAADYGRIQS